MTASNQSVMWYSADDESDSKMDTVLSRANDFQGNSFKASFYNLTRLIVDLWGLASVEPDIQRVEAILSEVSFYNLFIVLVEYVTYLAGGIRQAAGCW